MPSPKHTRTLIILAVLSIVLIACVFGILLLFSTGSDDAAGGDRQLTRTGSEATQDLQVASTAINPATSMPPVIATQIADANVEDTARSLVVLDTIRIEVRSNVSQRVVGRGTVTVYAPANIPRGNSDVVRLSLALDSFNPPENAEIIRIRPTITPVSDIVPTPLNPVVSASVGAVYDRMGATLLCVETIFAGCGEKPSRPVLPDQQEVTFLWTLTALEGARGSHPLSLELWYPVENLDGSVEQISALATPLTFSISVTNGLSLAAIITNPLVIASGFIGVMLLGIVGGFILSRPNNNHADTPHNNHKNAHPYIFISYRRDPSWSVARTLANTLETRGARVFLDVDDINEGRFADVLQKAIADCDYFVPILSPTTLDSKWVQREIQTAIELKKSIIPLVTDDFSFYGVNLPAGLEELSSHNAIKVTPEFFEEAIDRLASRFIGLNKP